MLAAVTAVRWGSGRCCGCVQRRVIGQPFGVVSGHCIQSARSNRSQYGDQSAGRSSTNRHSRPDAGGTSYESVIFSRAASSLVAVMAALLAEIQAAGLPKPLDRVVVAVADPARGQGMSALPDVAMADLVPAGFSMPAGGWNLAVTDGNGTALAHTGTTPASITLTDPAADQGALTEYDASSGTNLAVVTFDAARDDGHIAAMACRMGDE